MRCPKCNGLLRSTSAGFYRNELESPQSLSCMNCGWYVEKAPEIITREIIKETIPKPKCGPPKGTIGQLRPPLYAEYDKIIESRKQKQSWDSIRAWLIVSYPELSKYSTEKIRNTFWRVYDLIQLKKEKQVCPPKSK